MMKQLSNFLKGLLGFFRHFPRTLTALLRLPQLIWLFIGYLRRVGLRCLKPRVKCRTEINIPPEIRKRADPMLYSQEWLMSMGMAVTWDNPDIQLFRNGLPVSSAFIEQGQDYEVRVQIWNNSYDAPAPGLPVHLTMFNVGAGTQGVWLGKHIVDLGAKGTSMCPAYATFKWRTPDTPGHYCLQARLDWPDDANPANNMGQENTLVGQLQSPAIFRFRARNAFAEPMRFVFEADDYQLPGRRPCPPEAARDHVQGATRLQESRARWAQALAAQGYGRQDTWRADWTVKIEPEKEVLDAGEEIGVLVSIEPKSADWHGRKPFNVQVFAHAKEATDKSERAFVGGMTLYVEK
jgi:hypothetical protein